MSIPSLHDKASLVLMFAGCKVLDFSPYNEYATRINVVARTFLANNRACRTIQKYFRGYYWRNIMFSITSADAQPIRRILKYLHPNGEWPHDELVFSDLRRDKTYYMYMNWVNPWDVSESMGRHRGRGRPYMANSCMSFHACLYELSENFLKNYPRLYH